MAELLADKFQASLERVYILIVVVPSECVDWTLFEIDHIKTAEESFVINLRGFYPA